MSRGQQIPLYDKAVDAAMEVEDAVIRLVRRDGALDGEERTLLTMVRRAVIAADRNAQNTRLAVATLRVGAESRRVKLIERDYIADPPEVA